MELYDIYIAFVSWGNEGKRRPILFLEASGEKVKAFKITTKYDSKSEKVKKKYFVINDWRQAGLSKLSYIDISHIIAVPLPAVEINPIGRLTEADEERFIKFLS